MTIRKGEAWGTVGPIPAGARTVHTDAELRALVVTARAAGEPIPPALLAGGDLMRAVGGRGRPDPARVDVARLPIDVVRIEVSDRTTWFVAHLIARRSWWRGELFAAMNAQHLGTWDVAPRSHPNDGRVDLVRAATSLSLRDRWRARRRLALGTHVPHPSIEVRQASTTTVALAREATLWLDGDRWGSATSFTLTVEPDAITVCV